MTSPALVVEPPDRLLTRRETCEALGGVSIPSLERVVRNGWLRPIRVTQRSLRFRQSDVEAYLASRQA